MGPICSKLKLLRLQHQFTQVQIAEKLNCSIPAYSKMETGSTDVNTARLYQIAAVYNIDVYEIFLAGEDFKHDYMERITALQAELNVKKDEIFSMQQKLIRLYESERGGPAM
ncbi:helix-turn-helix domain-containing protein [Pedobacter duraquae]|uniref:Transcriptional regulator with XRE-family HTH domain n=1 Tax=Pedobacter duraquae TaxID=425511 RepID=A0A4R6IEK9_9SPHI|nr:helix-turn-helix transcriptional regulator [Pedobacter duraquae]TDO20068.1 transcriptional regulator with XRE-family HTH domain [Pedobacter duraquae]